MMRGRWHEVLLLLLLLLLQLAPATISLLKLHEVMQCLGLVISPSVRIHLHHLMEDHVREELLGQTR